MKKKIQDHHKKINHLVSKLEFTVESANQTGGLTLEALESLNSISDKLQRVCACVFHEHFEQPPTIITRKDFREDSEKRQTAFDSRWGYQIVNEDGKVFLSSGSPSQFEFSSSCPAC